MSAEKGASAGKVTIGLSMMLTFVAWQAMELFCGFAILSMSISGISYLSDIQIPRLLSTYAPKCLGTYEL